MLLPLVGEETAGGSPQLSRSGSLGRQNPRLLECLCRRLLETHPIIDVAQEQMQRGLVGIGHDPDEEFPACFLVEPFPEEEASPQQENSILRNPCKRGWLE
jgi:hypothetical protein